MKREIEQLCFYPYPIDYYTNKYEFEFLDKEQQINIFYDLTTLTPEMFMAIGLDKSYESLINTSVSIRYRKITKEKETSELFILKNKVNGSNKLELELVLTKELQTILDSLTIASSWKRDRSSYLYKGFTFNFNKNTGYGNTVEIEKVLDLDEDFYEVEKSISNLVKEFGFIEIPTDLLEKMYKYYCANWQYYYNNDAAFIGYFVSNFEG